MALETLNGINSIMGEDIVHLDSSIPQEEYLELIKNKYIIHGKENNTVIFKIQNGPIKENGKNGCQVDHMLAVASHIIRVLNTKVPCDFNEKAIMGIEDAISALEARRLDRENRNVEGTNYV